uniref:Si:dkey-221l4.10 n=1 Tax=Poecilia latipinna TaxID=48699 RepID=A0A3B3UEH7_9TELE
STTVSSNTTSVTKSREQILIQSGAMIAVIVIGIIIILALVLIVLKTYNRTHESRLLGGRAGSKPRPKTSQSTFNGSVPLNSMGVSSVSGSITHSNPVSEDGFQLSRADGNHSEQFSTTSDYSESTVVTVHDTPSPLNT